MVSSSRGGVVLLLLLSLLGAAVCQSQSSAEVSGEGGSSVAPTERWQHWVDNIIATHQLVFRIGRLEPFGFHGDFGLLTAVATAMQAGARIFVETGTHAGSTLHYMLRTYPSLAGVFTCEILPNVFNAAVAHTKSIRSLFEKTTGTASAPMAMVQAPSVDLLEAIKKQLPDVLSQPALFWLDAHGAGMPLPLPDEVALATRQWTSGYIFIDDFVVPGASDQFGYDDLRYSMDLLRHDMDPTAQYAVYFPAYRQHTSFYHPLRGWVLIQFNHPHHPGAAPNLTPLQSLIDNGIAVLNETLSTPAVLQHFLAAKQDPLLSRLDTVAHPHFHHKTPFLRLLARLVQAHATPLWSAAEGGVADYSKVLRAAVRASASQEKAPESPRDMFTRLVEELQSPEPEVLDAESECQRRRFLVIPSVAELEAAWVRWAPGATRHSLSAEDRLAGTLLAIGAWHTVAWLTGRVLIESDRVGPWDLAPPSLCKEQAGRLECFFGPLSSCHVGAMVGMTIPDLNSAEVLAAGRSHIGDFGIGSLRDSGPQAVRVPQHVTAEALELLHQAGSQWYPDWVAQTATDTVPRAPSSLWPSLFVHRVFKVLFSVGRGDIAGRQTGTVPYLNLVSGARFWKDLTPLSVGVHVDLARESTVSDFRTVVHERLKIAKAVHKSIQACHSPLGLTITGASPEEEEAIDVLYGLASPEFSLVNLGPRDHDTNQVVRAIQDILILHSARVFIGTCQSPFSHLIATLSYALGGLVVPPVTTGGEADRLCRSSGMLDASFGPPMPWQRTLPVAVAE